MQHHASFKRKTRSIFTKGARTKGKISIRKFFQEFQNGDRVILKAEPAYQKALYYPRFHGKAGFVMGKRGACFEILIKDGGKEKLVVVHPIHLKRSE